MAIRAEGGGGSGTEASGASKFKASGTGSPGGTGQVYMGTRTVTGAEGRENDPNLSPAALAQLSRQSRKVPIVLGENDALAAFDSMSQKQLRDFILQGQVGGQLKEGAGPIEAYALWKKLVARAQSYTAAGRQISPADVLGMYVTSAAQDAQSVWQTQFRGGRKFLVNTQTGEVKYQGPKFETTTQRSIDLTDPVTAKAIATSLFQQMMHRDPGKGEMAGFADALRNAEQNSPVVAETTTEYDPNTGEAIGTSTTTSGGMTADAKAYLGQQKIKKSKEYGVTQAATTYASALEDAVFNNPFGSVG